MVGNVGSQSTKGHEGQKISTKGHEGTRRKTKRKKIPRTDASCPAPLVPRATRPRPASQGHSTPKNVSPTPLSGFANHGSPWGGDWWVFSRVGECGADHSRKNGRSLMKANHEWTRINTNRPEDRGPPSTTSGTKMVLQFCDLGVTVSWDDGFPGDAVPVARCGVSGGRLLGMPTCTLWETPVCPRAWLESVCLWFLRGRAFSKDAPIETRTRIVLFQTQRKRAVSHERFQ